MKFHGKVVNEVNYEFVVIPRPSGPIVFKAEAVLDYTDFHHACPIPMPPTMLKPGGLKVQNVEDPGYKQDMAAYGTRRLSWLVLKSLQNTDGLVWETVDMADPSTWINYEEELRSAKFTKSEIEYIIGAVISVNALDQTRLDEARNSFLAGQLVQQNG